MSETPPVNAPTFSPDGNYWWNGSQWIAVPPVPESPMNEYARKKLWVWKWTSRLSCCFGCFFMVLIFFSMMYVIASCNDSAAQIANSVRSSPAP